MPKTHDFDIGYLVKSPCRSCERAGDLPECMEQCKTLLEVQKLLCQGRSISSQSSPDDESALYIGRDTGNT
jgi:hypothetical protein